MGVAIAAVLAPAAAVARPVPALRTSGPAVVACRPDSAARIRRGWPGRGPRTAATRRALLQLAAGCRHGRLQDAIDAAGPGTRILVLPGVYRGAVTVRGRDRQLEGLGRRARDVVVQGDRRAANVIRADRADGLVIANLTAEQGGASDVHVVRTDGFRLHRLVVRWAQDDGVRTDGADHGLLDRIEAYGNGSAGLRVGAGAEGRCGSRRGLEVRDFNVYGNVLGLWVAAGDAVWAHHARLAGNATGAAAAPLGPQTPRGCLRLEHLSIAANNAEVYAAAAPCRTAPFARRRAGLVCPRVPTPVGTGLLLRGVNGARVRANAIYGNRRAGVKLAWMPAAARGLLDPTRQFDTSNGNRFEDNRLGVHLDGAPAANGVDVAWDGEGAGNCWSGDTGPAGAAPTSDRPVLPPCPRGSLFGMGDPTVQALEVPCAAWNPEHDPDPPGCDWFAAPPPR